MLKLVLLGFVSATLAFDYTSVPGLNYDKWWGDSEETEEDPSIIDFKIEFPEDVVEDLLSRLAHTREFVPSMNGVAYNYGVNTHTFGYWLDQWQNHYNFTEREAYLNQFPHKKTMIQVLWVHFIHIKPEVPENKTRIPLLMLHGFPGSIREFYGTIPCIVADNPDRDYVVEVVAPSLIGFGFSDYTNKTGLGAAEMPVIFKKLMNKLGHDKFYVQGGDWGAHIADFMSLFFQDEVLGHHTNLGLVATNTAYTMLTAAAVHPESMLSKHLVGRLYPLEDTLKFIAREFAIGVTQSPASLLGWLFQLFSMASRRYNIDDPEGGLHLYTPEQLLDNAMIYWITNKAPSAMRIYAETANMRNYNMDILNEQTKVPTVVVQAANEIYFMSKPMLNSRYTNLLIVDTLDDYGHFLALEAPELFCKLVHCGLQKMIDFHKKEQSE